MVISLVNLSLVIVNIIAFFHLNKLCWHINYVLKFIILIDIQFVVFCNEDKPAFYYILVF